MVKFTQIVAVTVLVAAMIAGMSSVARADQHQHIPSPVNLKGLMGSKLTSDDMKNKIVVFQFFASWCVGCEKTMQDMIEITKDRKEVVYVPVSVDEDVKSARSFFVNKAESIKALEAQSFVDTSTEFAARLNVKAVPSVIVAGSDGVVLSRSAGHPTKERLNEFKATLEKAGVKHNLGASH